MFEKQFYPHLEPGTKSVENRSPGKTKRKHHKSINQPFRELRNMLKQKGYQFPAKGTKEEAENELRNLNTPKRIR